MIGGYDDARVAGEFSTFDSRDDCPACLELQELAWVTESGHSISLLNESMPSFKASLEPLHEDLFLPSTVFEAFGKITGGVYDQDWQSYKYPASVVPTGDLSFKIKGGYSSSIPASQLFSFPQQYQDNATVGMYDDTFKLAHVQPYQSTDDSFNAQALFGTPFLTMNYLIMEQNQFRLSKAVREDRGIDGEVIAKTLCPAGSDSTTTSKKNVHDIVGGVVGGLGGMLIIMLAFLLWLRWRKQHPQRTRTEKGYHAKQVYHPITPAGDTRIRLILEHAKY